MHPYHPDNWPPVYDEPAGGPIQFRTTRAQPQPSRVIPHRSTDGGQGRATAARPGRQGESVGARAATPPPAASPIQPAIATAWRAGRLTAQLEHQTDRAWLVLIELAGTVRKIWLPKSKCRQIGANQFVVPRWLAALKGLTA